jgi:hypothetical protein
MIVGATMAMGSAPAAAGAADQQSFMRAEPRALAAFSVAAKRVEVAAVTRRARADTPLRREHLEESLNMAKVMPGYPQPAFVSLDFRLKF